jgi:hypothetical protein
LVFWTGFIEVVEDDVDERIAASRAGIIGAAASAA